MQLTAACDNQAETLEAEKAACEQHRIAIAELGEEALATKVGNSSRSQNHSSRRARSKQTMLKTHTQSIQKCRPEAGLLTTFEAGKLPCSSSPLPIDRLQRPYEAGCGILGFMQESLPQVLRAAEGRDRAQADLDVASAAVEAAACQLARLQRCSRQLTCANTSAGAQGDRGARQGAGGS